LHLAIELVLDVAAVAAPGELHRNLLMSGTVIIGRGNLMGSKQSAAAAFRLERGRTTVH
jgi:hypothetical protein